MNVCSYVFCCFFKLQMPRNYISRGKKGRCTTAEPSVEVVGKTGLQPSKTPSPKGEPSITIRSVEAENEPSARPVGGTGCPSSSIQPADGQSPSTSFFDLMPLPHYSNSNAKRKPKACHSDVLTSTPYKKQLETEKTIETNKQKTTAKKNLVFASNKKKQTIAKTKSVTTAMESRKEVNL